MKTSKAWIIGLAATGVAIAGTIIFFTATKAGKKTIKNWGSKGEKLAVQAEDIIKNAKKKFDSLKEEFACKDEELATHAYE